MKVIIRSISDPQHEIDLTNRLVSAIAQELWQRYGGNDQLNWLEAELHLQEIVRQARAEAEDAVFIPRGHGDTESARANILPFGRHQVGAAIGHGTQHDSA